MNPTPSLAVWSDNFYWHLPLMIVVISLVYSATRFDQWPMIFREAFRWGLRMTLFLIGIVLILSGLSLEESSWLLRTGLIGVGAIVEISLLFLK
jgi:hypothetical protein